MKIELKDIIWWVALGASVIGYTHSNFATKDEVKSLKDILKVIDKRIYDMHKQRFPNKRRK